MTKGTTEILGESAEASHLFCHLTEMLVMILSMDWNPQIHLTMSPEKH